METIKREKSIKIIKNRIKFEVGITKNMNKDKWLNYSRDDIIRKLSHTKEKMKSNLYRDDQDCIELKKLLTFLKPKYKRNKVKLHKITNKN